MNRLASYVKKPKTGAVLVFTFLILITGMPTMTWAVADNTIIDNGGSTNCEPGKLCNPIGSQTLSDFVDKITTAAVKIGVVIASLFIIYSGLIFVMARGSDTELTKAKGIFWYTIIGTAILLAANVLAKVLMSTISNVVK